MGRQRGLETEATGTQYIADEETTTGEHNSLKEDGGGEEEMVKLGLKDGAQGY